MLLVGRAWLPIATFSAISCIRLCVQLFDALNAFGVGTLAARMLKLVRKHGLNNFVPHQH